jgi:hypothetical protein
MAVVYYMDPDKLRAVSQGLNGVSMVLKGVSAVLEVQMNILKFTAFIGLVGGAAVERYLAYLKPQIDEMAKKSQELSERLDKEIAQWVAAQQKG